MWVRKKLVRLLITLGIAVPMLLTPSFQVMATYASPEEMIPEDAVVEEVQLEADPVEETAVEPEQPENYIAEDAAALEADDETALEEECDEIAVTDAEPEVIAEQEPVPDGEEEPEVVEELPEEPEVAEPEDTQELPVMEPTEEMTEPEEIKEPEEVPEPEEEASEPEEIMTPEEPAEPEEIAEPEEESEEESVEEEILPLEETVLSEEGTLFTERQTDGMCGMDLGSSDDLLQGYFNRALYGDSMLYDSWSAGNELSGVDRTVYDLLRTGIEQVAAGQRSSTAFEISFADLGWNAGFGVAQDGTISEEALGLSGPVNYQDGNGDWQEDESILQEAQDKIYEMLIADLRAVNRALLSDCPYDLYWYAKSVDEAISTSEYGIGWTTKINYSGNTIVGMETFFSLTAESITYYLAVDEYYQGGDSYLTDTSKTSAASTAAATAQQIAGSASGSDEEILEYFKDFICDQVTYDHNAANYGPGAVGYSPWQVINVFDGNSSTNVVCEGYSKAFRLLCDLCPNLDGYCITVTGDMDGGTGAGAHMWNIVRLGRRNYMVDVTNCDDESIGYPAELFLKDPVSGTWDSEYVFSANGSEISYEYDLNTREMYGENMLVLGEEEPAELHEEYYFPIEEQVDLLPGWDRNFGGYFDCHIWDDEHLVDEFRGTQVRTVELDSTDVITLEPWDNDYGWRILANRMGSATLEIYYNDYNGEPVDEPYLVQVNVCGEIWNLNLDDTNSHGYMIPGDQLDIFAYLSHEYNIQGWENHYDEALHLYDPNTGNFDEDATNISYEWEWFWYNEDGNPVPDEDSHNYYFTISDFVDDNGFDAGLHINARANVSMGLDIEVYMMRLHVYHWTDPDNCEEVVSCDKDLHIQGGFAIVRPTHLTEKEQNVLPGDSFEIDPKYFNHWIDDYGTMRTEEDPEMCWSWEWDPNAVKIYDSNGKELTNEDPYGEAPFTIEKLENWQTEITIWAEELIDPDDPDAGYRRTNCGRKWNLQQSNMEVFWPNDVPYDEGGSIILYEDGICELRPEFYGLDNEWVDPDNLEIEWTVGNTDENGNYHYVLTEGLDMEHVGQGYVKHYDGRGINLIGSALIENLYLGEGGFNIRAVVKYNGYELKRNDIWISIRGIVADYHYPLGDWSALPGWWLDFDGSFTCWTENDAHPYGEDVWVHIVDVYFEPNDESEPDAVTVESYEDEDGRGKWHINANQYCSGLLTIEYTTYYAPDTATITESESFWIWVGHDVWNLWIDSNTGENQLLPGDSLDLLADFDHLADYDKEPDSDEVIYVWQGRAIRGEVVNWDDLFDCEVDENDPSILHVTAKADAPSGSRGIMTLSLRITDEEGFYDVAYQEYEIWVQEDYTSIHPIDLKYHDVLPGGFLEYGPEVHRYYLDDQGVRHDEILDDIVWRWEWDPNAVRITDATGEELLNGDDEGIGAHVYGEVPFTITKLENWDQNIRIIAEDENGHHEVCRREFHLDSVDPEFCFDNLHWDDRDAAHIYTNETFCLCPKLDWIQEYYRSHSPESNYRIEWQIGQVGDDGIYIDELEPGEGFIYALDGVGILLDGAVLKEHVNPGTDGVSITACLMVGEEPIAWANLWMSVWDCVYDYQYPLDNWEGLPGWWMDFDKDFNCHVEDAEHPGGPDSINDIEVHIVDAVFTPDEGTMQDAITLNGWDDGNGWHLQAHDYGSGTLTIFYTTYTYPDDPLITLSHDFYISVGEDVWNLWINSSTGTDQILPGGTMDLTADFEHYFDYEEDAFTNKGYFIWEALDGAEELVDYTVDSEYPAVLHVTAKEDAPNGACASFRVRLQCHDDHLNYYDVQQLDYNIWINNDYMTILPADLEFTDLLPGLSVEYDPELHWFHLDENGENREDILEDIFWRWEWDPEAVQITDVYGNELTYGDEEGEGSYIYGQAPFTITKRNDWEQNLTVIAEMEDENGNLREFNRRDWHLNNPGVDFHFGDDLHWNGEGAAHIYEDENEFYLWAQTGGIDDYFRLHHIEPESMYRVDWQIGMIDENSDNGSYIYVLEPGEGFTYTEDGKGLILDGSVLKDHVNPGTDGVNITARLIVNEMEIARCDLWMSVWECITDFDFPDHWEALPGWGLDLGTDSSCYVENGQYPEGENLPVHITDVQVQIFEGDSDAVSIEQSPDGNNWHIQAEGDGGEFLISVYYTLDGEAAMQPYQIYGWIGSDVYNLWISSSTGDNRMLPGASLDLEAYIYRHSYDYQNRREYEGDTSDITYVWEFTNDNWEEFFTWQQDPEDPSVIHVSAKADTEDGGSQVVVYAVRSGEDTVQSSSYWIGVRNNYYWVYTIQDTDQFDLAPGQTVELDTELRWKYLDDQGQAQEDIIPAEEVRWSWSWDENAAVITDANGKQLSNDDFESSCGVAPFTVEKIQNWYTTIIVTAEIQNKEGNYEQAIRWAWDLRDVNMDISVSGLRAPWENRTVVYEGETDYELTLDTASLDALDLEAGADYEIIWNIGTFDNGEFVEESLLVPGVDYTLGENGKTASFNGTLLKELADQDRRGFDIGVELLINDQMVGQSDLYWMEVREPVYDYHLGGLEEDVLIPGMAFYIPQEQVCYVDDPDHPYGEDVPFMVTDVTLYPDNGVDFTLTWTDQYGAWGWRIGAVTLGADTMVSIYYKDIYGQEVQEPGLVHITVAGEVWWSWIDPSTGIGLVLPGGEVDLIASVSHPCFDAETGERYQGDTNVVWAWGPVEEPIPFNEVFDYQQDPDDSAVLHVTAKTDYDGNINCGIRAIAYLTDENGTMLLDEQNQPIEVTRTDFRLEKSESYLNLDPVGLEKYDVHPGETFTIDPMLYHYYLDNHGDQVVEALWAEYIHWYFDWEEDKLQITDSTGKVLTADDCYGAPPFTFKKLQTEGTGFTLIAETPYMTQEGWSTDYKECFRRDWYLDEADHTDIVTDAAVEATCTHTGLTQGSHCADCGVVIEEQQLIPMKAHTLERVARVEPTTSAEGNIEYWTCTVCHKYFSDEAGTHEISQADTIIEKLELTGWQKIDGKWYYYSTEGVMQTGWQKISKKWYYFGTDGVMRTGWQKISKKWYYFGTNGVMRTGWQTISSKQYFFNSSGVMLTGWQTIGDEQYYFKQYYFNSSGVMLTGWQTISDKQYYLGTDGAMVTGWKKVSDQWYYFGTDGVMTTGWQKVSGKWYYLGTDGVMKTGWQKISKKWYYLGTDGIMQTGWQKISKKWYYFGTDGIMRTGWQKISAKWYYFNSSGVMLTGTHTIDGKSYTFDSSGVWDGK